MSIECTDSTTGNAKSPKIIDAIEREVFILQHFRVALFSEVVLTAQYYSALLSELRRWMPHCRALDGSVLLFGLPVVVGHKNMMLTAEPLRAALSDGGHYWPLDSEDGRWIPLQINLNTEGEE